MTKPIEALEKVGDYALFLWRVYSWPDKFRESFKEFVKEVVKLGVNSLWLVVIISIFIGASIVIQIALNISFPLLPRFTVGVVSREIILLEFSSTIVCLILAGKVGSNIASEIGTMRVTEQIDALDIMGVNSANFLVLPRILALVLFMPILVVFSMAAGLAGGYLICWLTNITPPSTYVYGIQSFFDPFYITYAILKSMLFASIITSVAAYYGYSVKRGAAEVGKASTNSVVTNSILILVSDLLFTQMVMG